MAVKKTGLGKGLGSLIPSSLDEEQNVKVVFFVKFIIEIIDYIINFLRIFL
jgi:hypothetical protein